MSTVNKLEFYTDIAKTIIENYDKVECKISTEKDHNVITDANDSKYFVCEKGIRPAYSKKFEDMYPEDSWMTDCEFAMFMTTS